MTGTDRIALVGLPGSGKSTVGARLAARLGWPCVDLDERVEADQGRSVAAIFAADGEAAFRRYEHRALLQALSEGGPAVLACGGGLMAQDGARHALLEHTKVVWLDAPDAVLLARLTNGSARPLLGDNPAVSLARLRDERTHAYEQAPLRILATEPLEAVVERIASATGVGIDRHLGSPGWTVEVSSGALAAVGKHLPAGATRVALIADRCVPDAAQQVADMLTSRGTDVVHIAVAGGEALKTWDVAGDVLSRLAQGRLRRGDCVLALGGGTVGDLAGFVAATYLRGIAWVNVPTTLLAMVDSAVGGKTGVNLPQGKNLAGAFWQPLAVVADTSLLAQLPERAYRSALGEVVKYAMIGTQDMATFVENKLEDVIARDTSTLEELVARCMTAKAAVVQEDPREKGPRQALNYGHTVAHALEAVTGFDDDVLTHGEAVATGMRAAGRLSARTLGCPDADIAWQDALLDRCGFGAAPPADTETVIARLGHDKKATAVGVGWVLLQRRGQPRLGQRVDDAAVREAVSEVLGR
ncbi:MAG TPA: 3-dehydroquinate synthase [Candidatus Dormibacteraeota bacterium]|nr:3-dehydroquinate synthase [Candidatus Dormibacteraeota bacterium]